MKVIKKFLNDDQYVKEESTKDKIILHHTVSSNVPGTLNWWNQTKERVATHYIIDKDGVVYQTMPEEFWAYHIGKGSNADDNKAAFGIEIINEGPIIKKEDGWYWFDGKVKYNGEVIDYEWRGNKYWATYTQKQFGATILLIKYLVDKYDIGTEVITNFEYDKKYFDHKGILSHHNLRSDKTDVSPAWNLQVMNKILNSMFNPLLFEPDKLKPKPLETIKPVEE